MTAPTSAEVKAMTDLICICGMRCSCRARERVEALHAQPGDDPDDWSEEEALAQGLLSCAVCERWATVPGSTRCTDCQEDEA